MKSVTHSTHISAYKGTTVAVDAYSWLHKGAYACSRELCEGKYTDKCGREMLRLLARAVTIAA